MNHSFLNRIFLGVLYQMDFFEKEKKSIDQKISFFVSKFMLTPYLALPIFVLSAILGIKLDLLSGLFGAIILYPIVFLLTYRLKEIPEYSINEDREYLQKMYKFSIWVIVILGVITIGLAYSPLNKLRL